MDKRELGSRVAGAREYAGLTQDGLGRAVGLDRTAVSRLERGDRKLSVPELAAIAEALQRPLTFFVQTPASAVVSRRLDLQRTHDSTANLDSVLELFASDVQFLLDMALLMPSTARRPMRTPRDHSAAEQMAADVREATGLGAGPLHDLGTACESLGLFTFAAPLGVDGPDGGCVEVGDPTVALGAAVINGEAPAGRRRMTLAHELAHWLAGDAYDSAASEDAERMLNSFAIHFLAPRAAVTTTWNQDKAASLRDRALKVSAEFRLSWTATTGQLKNLGLIDAGERRALDEDKPFKGDFLRLRLRFPEELGAPYLSRGFAAAGVGGYVTRRLTSGRTVELLRGTLSPDELPSRPEQGLDDLRRSFEGHGD